MKIKFAETEQSDEISFQNGEYSRTFRRSEEPFDVTDEEWRALCSRGIFAVADETPPPPSQNDSLQQEGGQQDAGTPKVRGKKQPQDN